MSEAVFCKLASCSLCRKKVDMNSQVTNTDAGFDHCDQCGQLGPFCVQCLTVEHDCIEDFEDTDDDDNDELQC